MLTVDKPEMIAINFVDNDRADEIRIILTALRDRVVPELVDIVSVPRVRTLEGRDLVVRLIQDFLDGLVIAVDKHGAWPLSGVYRRSIPT